MRLDEDFLSDTSRQLAGVLFLALVTVETGGLYMLKIVRGRQEMSTQWRSTVGRQLGNPGRRTTQDMRPMTRFLWKRQSRHWVSMPRMARLAAICALVEEALL